MVLANWRWRTEGKKISLFALRAPHLVVADSFAVKPFSNSSLVKLNLIWGIAMCAMHARPGQTIAPKCQQRKFNNDTLGAHFESEWQASCERPQQIWYHKRYDTLRCASLSRLCGCGAARALNTRSTQSFIGRICFSLNRLFVPAEKFTVEIHATKRTHAEFVYLRAAGKNKRLHIEQIQSLFVAIAQCCDVSAVRS